MTRKDISKKIQSNQKVDNSTREWCERLIDDIFSEYIQFTCTKDTISNLSNHLESGKESVVLVKKVEE